MVYTKDSLQPSLNAAQTSHNKGEEQKLGQLIAVGEGAFDFPAEEINLTEQDLIDAHICTRTGDEPRGAERLETWLMKVWAAAVQSESSAATTTDSGRQSAVSRS